MNKLKFALVAFFVLSFLSTNLISQNNEVKVPLDSRVKTGKLSNGMTYFIMNNKKPENRAEMRLVVNAGSVCEDDDQKGLAHFCEHMAFNGTKNFPRQALIDYVQLIGMQFGPDLNAYTSFDETVYMLQVPTDKKDILEKGLLILQDWGSNISFLDDEIDKERGVIWEEWRSGKGAEERIYQKQLPYMFYDSKYAKRDVIGDTSIILHAPYDAFRRFYRDWYRPNNMAVIVVGDVDVNYIENYIKTNFSKLENPPNPRTREKYTLGKPNQPLISVETDKELSYPQISVTFLHPERSNIYEKFIEMQLTERLFATMLNNRYNEYRTAPNPPFMFAFGSYDSYIGDKDAFQAMCNAKADDIEYSYRTLLSELFRAYQTGFTASELERAKTQLIRGIEKQIDEMDKTESRIYASRLIQYFLNETPMAEPKKAMEYANIHLKNITIEEANNRYKEIITPQNPIIMISAPDMEGVKYPDRNAALALFNEIKNSNLVAYVDKVSDKPLFSKKIQAGKITKETKNQKLDYYDLTLSNGVRVILKKTDFKNDEILIQAFSEGGSSLVSNSDLPAMQLAAQVISQSGIDEFDFNTLNKMLSGKIARVSPYISNLEEGLNGSSSVKDIEAFFQLIHLYFTNPRFDNNAFQAVINQYKDRIKADANNPESVFFDSTSAITYEYNPRMMSLTNEQLDKIDGNKLFESYKQRFANPADFTFIFIGSIDIDATKKLIETYIASLKTSKTKEKWVDNKVRPIKKSVNWSFFKGMDHKSVVLLQQYGDFVYNPQNRLAMRALNEYLDNRLREVIREDKSGTYGAYAGLSGSKYPYENYSMTVYWGCQPERVDELTNAVIDIFKELKTKDADDKNIQKIKETFIRDWEMRKIENRYWAGIIKNSIFYNEDASYISEFNKMIEKIDAKMIRDAANKYIDENKIIKFKLFPESMKN